MLLRDIAHTRTGDKGDRSTISVIAYDRLHFELLERCLTPERMMAHFEGIAKGPVFRYSLPQLGALNFVMHNALGGGVTRSSVSYTHLTLPTNREV